MCPTVVIISEIFIISNVVCEFVITNITDIMNEDHSRKFWKGTQVHSCPHGIQSVIEALIMFGGERERGRV